MRQHSTWYQRGVCVFSIVLSLIGLGPGASFAEAQTRFLQPDTLVDFSKYRFGEECFAAFVRTQTKFEHRQRIWRDTTFKMTSEMEVPLAGETVDITRQCLRRFSPDTVPLNRWDLWVDVLLAANRDADAMTVVHRRLATLKDTDSVGRFSVLKKAFSAYFNARPVRLATADSVLQQIEALLAVQGVLERVGMYDMRFGMAWALRDTTGMLDIARRTMTIVDSLSPQERIKVRNDDNGRRFINRALDILSLTTLRDSLRKSASAFVALKRANWEKAGGKFEELSLLRQGIAAPRIEADFWFSRKGGERDTAAGSTMMSISHEAKYRRIDSLVRPTPGHVGLIVYLYGGCHKDVSQGSGPKSRSQRRDDCWGTIAAMRRLGERFPDLEITIVSQTTGFVGDGPILPPEEEANTLANWLFDFHHLPGVLAVSNTAFFRLESPDNRRIDDAVTNAINYAICTTCGGNPRQAYVVDPSGMIVHANRLDRESEADFQYVLEILIARYRAGRTSLQFPAKSDAAPVLLKE